MNRGIASLLVRLAVVFLIASPLAARAVCFSQSPDDSVVSETYDAASDRYYSAWASSLQPLSCDFGTVSMTPPAGTLPTGLQWTTKSYAGSCPSQLSPECSARSHEVCVFRASGQVEPASLFLTINEDECAQLKAPGSGWTYLPPSRTANGTPSLSAFAVDPASGRCASGLVPVYRFVNQRWPDRGNHRYVADEPVRAQMQARADWREEGIALCALSSGRAAISTIAVPKLAPLIVPSASNQADCIGGYGAFGSCVYTANMAAFDVLLGPPLDAVQAAPFTAFTGALDTFNYVSGYSQGPALHSFVQTFVGNAGAGIYVSSVDRTAGESSSIRTITRAMNHNLPVLSRTIRQPFLAAYDTDMDLLFTYRLFVKRVRVDGNNEAYVQPLVSFIDQRSGKRLVVSPGAIGTPDGSGDLATRDAASGDVLVYLALKAGGASIGRSGGLPTLMVGKTFDAPNAWGYGGDFAWRVNRREFPAILTRARTVDSTLSADPQDYILEGVGIKGEVVGTAAIGFNLQQMSASIVRP